MRKFIIILISFLFISPLFGQSTASWQFEHKKNDDGTIDLIFKAKIESNWYMYNSEAVDMGPMATAFEVTSTNGYELVGKLRDLETPVLKMDEAFGIEVKIFEDNASFIQTIRPVSSGDFTVEGLLVYQTCNGSECLMDETDVKITLKGDGEATAPVIPQKSEGLFLFLLIAFAAGLGGVFTPCVFPMIPMTVSFFISGGGNKRNGILKGVVFGLSVTLIYTLIGVIVALFQSTDATDVLGTHWLPNLIFAVLFIVFAISFFGAFEITLPSGLANKADAKADKGGLIASFFVALAMVIVSFSCTGPFVGSILAAAVTGGLAVKPIFGMMVFGLAFSMPFVLFSFFPSLMKKMPKSGGWLNVVKVIFAFILLGFSFKYLASADAYFGLGIITRSLVISIWIVISILLGVYLLGKIKTSHDSDIESVGTFRLLFAIASFSFAVYLVPGLFGAPLNSLSGLLPPADESTFTIGSNSNVNYTSNATSETQMGLCGPVKYANPRYALPYGLVSYHDIQEAIECGREQNKPVLLAFKSLTCSACKVMEAKVWSDPAVLEILKDKLVLATLYVDDRTELPIEEQITSTIDGKVKNTLGRKLRDYQLTRFGKASQPLYVIIGHNEEILSEPVGETGVENYLKFLNIGLNNFK